MTELSIVISSYNRLALLRRTLWGIATRPPSVPFEVILVDDGSTEDVLSELKNYSSRFHWKFIRFNGKELEDATGLTKFHNNPCVTNNIGFRHSAGRVIAQQGNEVIPWGNVYDQLLADSPKDTDNWMVMSTTYDIAREHIEVLDSYGSNLTQAIVEECYRWPLQSKAYRSDVTNYICMASRGLWLSICGYDERYYGGISAEDSDFVRRARKLPDFKQVISEGISLHQFHQGKTCYYSPPKNVITKERWDEGVKNNHAIYNNWDGCYINPQLWPWGKFGVVEVITNNG